MKRLIQPVLIVALIAAGTCLYKFATTPNRDWVRVARDVNYEIALDRRSVKPVELAFGRWVEAVEVSYRTDHALPRMHNGKTFDREIVRALVLCDGLSLKVPGVGMSFKVPSVGVSFKVLSVDMSVGDGRPVGRLRTSENELWRQDWRRVERGTTEEVAAMAACRFGGGAAEAVADVARK